MKFLIVDDSRAIQVIIRRGLEKAGYLGNDFRTADNGREAIDIIRDWEADLVLTDWYMPEMTGMELLVELKRQMLPFKVGFVTTETSPERLQQLKDAGALFVVNKPFDIETLHNAVLPILQGSVEGEQALTSYDSAKDDTGYDVVLPTVQSLTKILDGYTDLHVQVQTCPPTPMGYKNLPNVMGLFSDNLKDVLKVICVLDLPGACIMGGALNASPAEIVREAIANRALPKALLDNNTRLLKIISALFYDPDSQQDLKLRGVHLIPKRFEKLDRLNRIDVGKRLDLKVGVEGYGEGLVTMLIVDE